MPNLVGLYYPSIQFRSDNWVKRAALYWDQLGRIVPGNYHHEDSDIVRQLIEESNFVTDIEPSLEDKNAAANLFFSLLKKHGRMLKRQYSIVPRANVSAGDSRYAFSQFIGRATRTTNRELNPELTYIASEAKMVEELRKAFLERGLASYLEADRTADPLGIMAMHPRLANTYMEVLAERVAFTGQMHPVTDDFSDHLAIGRYTLERLTNTLISANDERNPIDTLPTAHDIEVQVANIALQSVFPRNIAGVPMKKIIHLRNKYRDELTEFQTYLHNFTADLKDLQEIKDPIALKMHLTAEYEKKLMPQIEELKRCLESLGIDTIMNALNVRAVLPALVTSLETYAPVIPTNPIIMGLSSAGAVVFSIFPVVRAKRKAAQDLVHSSPVAYLLHLREGLSPSRITERITRFARRSIVSV